MDVALGTNYALDYDLSVDPDSIDLDDVASPTLTPNDAKHHVPLLSSFLL